MIFWSSYFTLLHNYSPFCMQICIFWKPSDIFGSFQTYPHSFFIGKIGHFFKFGNSKLYYKTLNLWLKWWIFIEDVKKKISHKQFMGLILNKNTIFYPSTTYWEMINLIWDCFWTIFLTTWESFIRETALFWRKFRANKITSYTMHLLKQIKDCNSCQALISCIIFLIFISWMQLLND